MDAVKDGIGELVYPVAEDEQPCFGGQVEVEVDVPVSEDEEVDVRMGCEIVFGKEYEFLLVFAGEGWFAALPFVLPPAVFRPGQAELHAPAGVQAGEETLAERVVEHVPQPLVASVSRAESVSVCQVEDASVDFRGKADAAMERHAAFPLEVVPHPEVVVSREEMYLHAAVRQLRQLAEQAGVAFGDDVSVFVPEVEHVPEQVDGGGLVSDAVKEVDQPAFLHPWMRDGAAAQMGVGEEIDGFHGIWRFCGGLWDLAFCANVA